MKSRYLDLILALALGVVVVSGFAYTWAPATTNINGSLGMSADGRVICAVPSAAHPSMSTNWGQTWTIKTNNSLSGSFTGHIAVSADGTKMVAFFRTTTNGIVSGIFASDDFGASWTKMNVPGVPTNAAISLASSAGGSKLIAGLANGPVYFSTNGGADWQTSSVPNLDWVSMASSADGGRMIGAVLGNDLYFSTNFGATWTPTNLPPQSWRSVCVSSDGKSIGATGNLGTYVSGNAGISWTSNKINGNTVACSANGSTWIVTGSQVYTSNDGGAAWQTNLSTGQWYNGAVSADGCELVAIGFPGGTMIGRVTPSPRLGIQATNGAIGISWLIPSTNFVLQQSTDLTSTDWLFVASSPLLNFTNLHYEVTVPVTASNSFFRLIAQ